MSLQTLPAGNFVCPECCGIEEYDRQLSKKNELIRSRLRSADSIAQYEVMILVLCMCECLYTCVICVCEKGCGIEECDRQLSKKNELIRSRLRSADSIAQYQVMILVPCVCVCLCSCVCVCVYVCVHVSYVCVWRAVGLRSMIGS